MKIVPLRPRPVRARPAFVPVEWNEGRGLYVAVCSRCTENLTTERFEQAHTWAEDHRCDYELAVLLAEVLKRRAA